MRGESASKGASQLRWDLPAVCPCNLQHDCGGKTAQPIQTGEFDPGSERTFAAGLTHASRTGLGGNSQVSGARVRNTWVINPSARDNTSKGVLIPDVTYGFAESYGKDSQGSLEDELAAHQLVGEVMAHQGLDG